MAALNEQIGIADAALLSFADAERGRGPGQLELRESVYLGGPVLDRGRARFSETLFDAGKRRGASERRESQFRCRHGELPPNRFDRVSTSGRRAGGSADSGAGNRRDQRNRSGRPNWRWISPPPNTRPEPPLICKWRRQQTALFAEQKALVDLLTRRMVSSVLLVEALGGGWDSSQLPAVSHFRRATSRLKTNLVFGGRDLLAVHAVDDQQIAPGVKVAVALAVFHHGLGFFVR